MLATHLNSKEYPEDKVQKGDPEDAKEVMGLVTHGALQNWLEKEVRYLAR